jgi:membrane-bound serine protease (ClpP class)
MKWLASMLVAATFFSAADSFAVSTSDVALVEIKGAIGPATAGYLARAIEVASRQKSACLIIQLDTPGGLVNSTEQIVQSIYGSKVPIVVFVAPSGAGAASAGTFITLAADVAAMAPHSTIGAAHPVGAGGEGDTNSIMWTKAENHVSSWARSIAEKRGRNAKWAESAVRDSKSITAEEALNLKVIDLIAQDVPDLLTQLNGRKIDGVLLKTAGAAVVNIPQSPGEHFFQMLWHPEVMLLLMLVAIYGILGEINNPGAVLPGVAGAIALVLFLYMSTILPINAAGIALILLSVALFLIDMYAPTHGVLTAGGILSFFLGALLLFNHAGPGFHLSIGYILAATAVTAAFFLFIVGAGWRAQRLPVRSGREAMLGKIVPAAAPIDPRGGKVFVEGEYWNAVSDVPVEKDQPVEITGLEGLTLRVKPKLNR